MQEKVHRSNKKFKRKYYNHKVRKMLMIQHFQNLYGNKKKNIFTTLNRKS